ncbi:oxoglutarate/iron-dependent dioxygenase [Artemisia annua]|uniref:gibberellin 3beta-dioxygenase n=1 Tax=Artemisia annua TaxID=35608 RepID=A0A2U1PSE9_ARTAN|nr:oxoglutarate/iron-dependent dioxygenase [Artemisia annua]
MTTLSEAYRNAPVASHQITPLDFDSLDRVPESHIWSQSDEPQQNIQSQEPQELSIPVIDLTDPNALDLIGQACKTWGIFQVINHGVPLALIKKVESESRRLFGLPTDEKHKVLRSANGATGYGTARISPFFDKCMWHEGFTIMGSCVEDANVLWPHDYKNFCETMDAYQNEMKLLTHKLLHLMLQTLNLTQEEMNWAISAQDSQAALQLNSYPSCPNPSNAIGLAPHTDSLLLTVLHQGGANGLEIFVEGLGWSPVNPVDGAFVVNIGDLLHILSNATFQAVNHRAMVNQAKQRISVAYFHGPPVESVVAPSSSFENPCFRSMLVKEFISLKAKNFHKALSMIRK